MKTSPPVLVEASPPQLERLPRPAPLSLRKLEFEAWAFENAKGDHDAAALMKRIEETPLITMEPRFYENLGVNVDEMWRFIEDLMSLVEAYEQLIRGEDDEDPGD